MEILLQELVHILRRLKDFAFVALGSAAQHDKILPSALVVGEFFVVRFSRCVPLVPTVFGFVGTFAPAEEATSARAPAPDPSPEAEPALYALIRVLKKGHS